MNGVGAMLSSTAQSVEWRSYLSMDTDGDEFITFEEYVKFLPMNPE